jgi:hypothetical protein
MEYVECIIAASEALIVTADLALMHTIIRALCGEVAETFRY